MSTLQSSAFRRVFGSLSSLFLLLFIGRLIYGYYYPGQASWSPEQSLTDFSGGRKNYASEKIHNTALSAGQTPAAGGIISQKYEKIATLTAQSGQFERDEAAVKSTVKAFNAVIQFEQNNGNAGHRTLQLLVGIEPERFDSFYVEMQKVGRITGKQVTKTDKTNEYLKLNAQIVSLTKTRNALLELKSRGGRIDEYIGLENRILEIETQLQDLGVQLGDYDEENEFCSVRFSLTEGAPQSITLAQRIKVALEWTIKYFCVLMLGLAFTLIAALILLQITDKVKSSQKPPDR